MRNLNQKQKIIDNNNIRKLQKEEKYPRNKVINKSKVGFTEFAFISSAF